MRKRIGAFLLTLAVLFGAFALGPATPAQASSVYGCGDGWICFYNYTNFNSAGGVWGHRIYGAGNWNTCITMPTSGTSFTNGTAYNAATSIVINNSGTNTLENYARFYDSNDCYGPYMMAIQRTDPNSLNLAYINLSNVPSLYGGGVVNDRISSFMINSWYP